MSQEVVAHVYDVANAGSDATVVHINRFFKDAIGLGGIFHTAIQVYTVCFKKDCNAHCEHELDLIASMLCWINRFANAGDAALDVAETTAVKVFTNHYCLFCELHVSETSDISALEFCTSSKIFSASRSQQQLKQAKKEIVTACKAASTFLTGTSSSAQSNVEDTSSSANNSFFEGTWVKSIISISMNPSKSLASLDGSDDEKSGDESESESDDDESDSDHSADKQDVTQEQKDMKSPEKCRSNGAHHNVRYLGLDLTSSRQRANPPLPFSPVNFDELLPKETSNQLLIKKASLKRDEEYPASLDLDASQALSVGIQNMKVS
ncbi:hypothetical protein PR202_ga18398 [Eleusine coracana subsp. coracana]|uniref:Uncharacterized protein n=1 Tax=Eleusine coracana subsp. coracana TaxID=191504 RepID=A0AAV5CSR7_ELECO|nr:hypothetical protein PR202_ga18398 [Eleusine coracana subsp. coracana]